MEAFLVWLFLMVLCVGTASIYIMYTKNTTKADDETYKMYLFHMMWVSLGFVVFLKLGGKL